MSKKKANTFEFSYGGLYNEPLATVNDEHLTALAEAFTACQAAQARAIDALRRLTPNPRWRDRQKLR